MPLSNVLPKELCCAPKPYIVLTGLDITFNAVHKSIWDAFSNNRRTDRLLISFSCLPGDHVYSRSKMKRSSYDWYIPKGILKSTWMNKHLNKIPAVVVVFFELDWDDSAWRERHLECASRVQVVRSSLQGRGSKVAVVLIQKSPPMPPGEDMIAAERAAALCSACDLSAKSLFVLPHTDHLLGYIIRLENAFFELAQTYYHTEARRVKAHKEFLNKTTHQLLFPRHEFKIAFFNELMQDGSSALRHYRQSYTHIHELRLCATNNMEVKVVGGYVNYKICKLCFLQNVPIDAISQFQLHIDQFKRQYGSEALLFEHSTWVSQQYLIFADLFNDALSQGLSAIPTQHPGFYYQQAAYYANLRKHQSLSLQDMIGGLTYPHPDPLQTDHLEFYGQRPWRQGHQSIDPPDAQKEKDGILALQLREMDQEHSWIIIPLLGSAISQFKKFQSCFRRKSRLMILIAIEYYHAKEYSEAATLLHHACAVYRQDRWCLLLSHILFTKLHCAYMLADLKTFCACSIELISCYSCLNNEEKSQIQMNLDKVLSGRLPQPLSFRSNICPVQLPEGGKEALKRWSHLSESNNSCLIDVNHFLPFVECKARFSKPQFNLDECVQLEVFSRITCPFPVELCQLWIAFSNSSYDKSCIVTNAGAHAGSLFYEPWAVKRHVFNFPAQSEDCNKMVEISSISVRLGKSESGSGLVLRWTGKSPDRAGPPVVGHSSAAWDEVKSLWTMNICERESKLTVAATHSAPALCGEVFPVTVSVTSKEQNLTARNVMLIASLLPGDDSTYQSTNLLSTPSSRQPVKTIEFQIGQLEAGDECQQTYYVVSSSAGSAHLSVRISYQVLDLPVLADDGQCHSHVTCSSNSRLDLSLDVVPAYNFAAHVTSLGLQSVASAYVGHPFLVLASLAARSPWPVEIVRVRHETPEDGCVAAMGGKLSDCEKNVKLEKDDTFVECTSAIVKGPTGRDVVDLGHCVVEWKRSGGECCTTSKFKLPSITVKSFPVSVSAEIPSCGQLRKTVSIHYKVQNTTGSAEVVDASLSPVEAFMFAGPKQIRLFLSPRSTQTVTFNLIPLVLGYQTLPSFRITSIQVQAVDGMQTLSLASVESYFQQASIPASLFVKPTAAE